MSEFTVKEKIEMKQLKKVLNRSPILNHLIRALYQRIKPANKGSLGYWINRYIPNQAVQVIQIGSNDGISGDPLHTLINKNKLWKVLFVEPVPQLFKLLKKNYGASPRFIFENSGVNESGINQSFYMVGDDAYQAIPDLSNDYKQIGSFSRVHVQQLSTPVLEQYIVELEVSGITLTGLLEKHKIKQIELLQIDAEGYDWKIVSQLKLNEYKPSVLIFEKVNLEEEEKKAARAFLINQYHMFSIGINYLCIRKDKLMRSDLRILSKMDNN